MNPLHLASIYSAFSNGGDMILPVLEYQEGNVPQYWLQDVFPEQAVDTVREDLIQVIENPEGTGAARQSGRGCPGRRPEQRRSRTARAIQRERNWAGSMCLPRIFRKTGLPAGEHGGRCKGPGRSSGMSLTGAGTFCPLIWQTAPFENQRCIGAAPGCAFQSRVV